MSERCKHCFRTQEKHERGTLRCPRPSLGQRKGRYLHYHHAKVYEGVPHVCSCGCGRTPKPPRQNWFSQECVDRFLMQNRQSFFRAKIYERDRGICATCQLNTEELEAKYSSAKRRSDKTAAAWLQQIDVKHPWARRAHEQNLSFWQADHIHPRHLGGEGTMENGQTLCLGCHFQKTARQRGLILTTK
jgi:5-methylcytosine-specific restriction protein A